ncbi:MAG: translation elongation factor Ts [Cyanophyceae cyanobacterium]
MDLYSSTMAEMVTANQVKILRAQTGAGIMDCKRALVSTNGDLVRALEWLRQRGIAAETPTVGQTTAEGAIASYIHTGNRIGVLVELNCQTDTVAKHPDFQDLAHNVAMQIAACSQVQYISIADVPGALILKEQALELGRDDLAGKPEETKAKIAGERVQKRLEDMCLLTQPYIRDQSINVEELVQKAIARFGEEIQVRRFSRFILGEELENQLITYSA